MLCICVAGFTKGGSYTHIQFFDFLRMLTQLVFDLQLLNLVAERSYHCTLYERKFCLFSLLTNGVMPNLVTYTRSFYKGVFAVSVNIQKIYLLCNSNENHIISLTV